jgi:hypothetical protein
VRPTDENQTGSRRPNLMSSSRRASGEINILAMLDGQSGKPLSRRFLAWPRIAWVGGAGVLGCALLGGLAWLLHDPVGGGFEGRAVHATLESTSATSLEAPDDGVPNPALRLASSSARGAAIVELAPPDGNDVARSPRFHPEELELREGHHATVTRPPIAPAMPPAAAPAMPPAARQVSRPAPMAAPRPVAKSPLKAASRPAAAQRPPVVAPHSRRSATPARPGAAAAGVDNDVALISAIIQHVNKRGELKDGPDCGDPPCPATMTKRQ